MVDTMGLIPDLARYVRLNTAREDITERYLKTDRSKWDVTFEDPVFFAKPFTAEWIFQRSTGDRIISHSCVEFEHDVKDMVPGILIGGSGKAKEEDGSEVVTPMNRPGGPRP